MFIVFIAVVITLLCCWVVYLFLKTKVLSELRLQNQQINTEKIALGQKLAEAVASAALNLERAKELQETVKRQATEAATLNEMARKLVAENTFFSVKADSLGEKLENHKTEIVELQRVAQLQFEKIANQILEEKTKKFTDSNKQNIEAMLKPLGQNIEDFKKKVEEAYDKEGKQRFSLEAKVKELVEQTNKVSTEANNLASALKGQAQKQGNWGEMILESILQRSGLVKDREYFVQPNIKAADGRNLRPDILVKLPDNRTVIVDSKVSLVGYDRYCSAETLDNQASALVDHLKSIRNHIDSLHGKTYDELEESLDFTMMFIPIEPAYLIAIQTDQELWAYAYGKRILLISPTNLIACLKLMADLWNREKQSKNAMEIVNRGERMYEKFVLFVETMEDLGKSINRSQDFYTTAIGQLKTGRGNLITQATTLKSLGLKSSKEIPEALNSNEIDTEEEH